MMKVTYKTLGGEKKTDIVISNIEFTTYNQKSTISYKYKNENGEFEKMLYCSDVVSIEEN